VASEAFQELPRPFNSAPADAIEAAVKVARQRAQKVDQAIRARAFRGEL